MRTDDLSEEGMNEVAVVWPWRGEKEADRLLSTPLPTLCEGCCRTVLLSLLPKCLSRMKRTKPSLDKYLQMSEYSISRFLSHPEVIIIVCGYLKVINHYLSALFMRTKANH